MQCTIKKYLKIVPGTIADYKPLSRFHYRDCKTGPVSAVYKIIDTHPARTALYGRGRATRIGCVERKSSSNPQPTDVIRNEHRNLITNNDSCEPVVGIIVYSMPACSVQLRNIATKGLFMKLGSADANMQIVNNNIRTIARVVIEPRYRALGLAYELVQKTMPLLNMPYIEALAVMGKVNPFFEKAGMTKVEAPQSPRCVQLAQALSAVGIEQADLVDIERTHGILQGLGKRRKAFIEKQITYFLKAYSRRVRNLPDCIRRTEFIINRLSDRPVYYLWRNADCDLKI